MSSVSSAPKPADDREAERPPGLGASAQPQRDRQRADECRHRRHHDWAEAHEAGLVDGFERLLAVIALGSHRKVHHHDAVLLDEADQHDHPDHRVEAQFGLEDEKRDQRAESGRGQT